MKGRREAVQGIRRGRGPAPPHCVADVPDGTRQERSQIPLGRAGGQKSPQRWYFREKTRMAEMERKRRERKGSEIRRQKQAERAHLSDAAADGRLETVRSLQP